MLSLPAAHMGKIYTMDCIICGAKKTINAHLFPKSFCVQIGTGWDGEKRDFVSSYINSEHRAKFVKTGIYDPDILCGKCDNVLGKLDKYAVEFCRSLYDEKIYPYRGRLPVIMDHNDHPRRLFLFALSIIWRFGVTTKKQYGRIDIGPYRERIKNILYHGAEIGENIDAVLTVIKADKDESEQFYRTPTPISNEYFRGYRFYINGLEFVVRLGVMRKNFDNKYTEKYISLRGNEKIKFIVMRFDDSTSGQELLHHSLVKPRDILLAQGVRSN